MTQQCNQLYSDHLLCSFKDIDIHPRDLCLYCHVHAVIIPVH